MLRPPGATDGPPAAQRSLTWPALAAATWCCAFAARGAYWAAGGTVGTGTLAGDLRRLATERPAPAVAVLWTTVAVELLAAAAALNLARAARRPERSILRRRPRASYVVAVIAGTALLGHGAMFSSLAFAASSRTPSEQRWYAAFWGPWFMLGGALFIAAAIAEHRRQARRPDPAARLGVTLAAALTAVQLVAAVGAL